jgi:hypothetical protein
MEPFSSKKGKKLKRFEKETGANKGGTKGRPKRGKRKAASGFFVEKCVKGNTFERIRRGSPRPERL